VIQFVILLCYSFLKLLYFVSEVLYIRSLVVGEDGKEGAVADFRDTQFFTHQLEVGYQLLDFAVEGLDELLIGLDDLGDGLALGVRVVAFFRS
jgi:hypothetical protein